MVNESKIKKVDVKLNQKDITEIFDTNRANWVTEDKQNINGEGIRTILHYTNRDSDCFITTSDLWNNDQLMSFVEKNSEDGRFKMRQESLKRFQQKQQKMLKEMQMQPDESASGWIKQFDTNNLQDYINELKVGMNKTFVPAGNSLLD